MKRLRITILVSCFFVLANATNAKTTSVPIEIPGTKDYIAPQINEIKGYFITICLGLLAFFAKEVFVWFKQRNNTTQEDLIELKRNDMIILNKMDMVLEQLKHKPDRNEVTMEILDRVQKEIEHAAKIR